MVCLFIRVVAAQRCSLVVHDVMSYDISQLSAVSPGALFTLTILCRRSTCLRAAETSVWAVSLLLRRRSCVQFLRNGDLLKRLPTSQLQWPRKFPRFSCDNTVLRPDEGRCFTIRRRFQLGLGPVTCPLPEGLRTAML